MGLTFPVRLASVERFLVSQHGARRFLTDAEEAILDRWAGVIVEAIADDWPVDTGLSSSSWEWLIFDDLDEGIGFTIINETPYVQFIHRTGTHATPALWETLIPQIATQYAPAMMAELMARIQIEEATPQQFYGPSETRARA